MVDPEHGDLVTYYDGDENPHQAIIVDPVPDAEYVTLVRSGHEGEEFGEGYHSKVTAETSVYPHADLDDQYTATGYAYKPGWDAEEVD